MSTQITIEGGIYFDPDHKDFLPKYKFFGGELSPFSTYLPVVAHTITATLPDSFQPQAAEIAALEAMREEAHKKFAETVMKIDQRINTLLAITNEVEA